MRRVRLPGVHAGRGEGLLDLCWDSGLLPQSCAYKQVFYSPQMGAVVIGLVYDVASNHAIACEVVSEYRRCLMGSLADRTSQSRVT